MLIISPCNPSSTVPELTHQLSQTHPSLIIAHAAVINVALASAREVGIPTERVVVLEGEGEGECPRNLVTISDLVMQGLVMNSRGLGRRLRPGEGRSKVAFFCASSGTTGKPKAILNAVRLFLAASHLL
jgi:4-coumarate--CoA ligase